MANGGLNKNMIVLNLITKYLLNMRKIKIILLIVIFTSCEGSIKNQNAKALEAIKNYTKDEFFMHNYNIEIIDFKIDSIKEVRPDSIVVKLIEAEIYNIAAKIADPSLENYSDFDTKKLNSFVLDQASHSKEIEEYSSKFKKYSKNRKYYLIDVNCKFTSTQINTNLQKNILWPKTTFLLSEDFNVIDAPTMFLN